MGRKRAREYTMKLLYQMEINEDYTNEQCDNFFENNTFIESEKEYILDAVKTVILNMEEIDNKIMNNIRKWKFHRLAKIDLCILRIAIYEIDYREDIPIQVSINEAIEISKQYSTGESSKFINGVLGGFVRSKNNK